MGREESKNAGPAQEDEVEEESPFPLTYVDRYNLSITDAEFQPHTWEELKDIIGENLTCSFVSCYVL